MSKEQPTPLISGYVVLKGNLSDGFEVHGPFDSFDDAAEAFPGPDTWVMEMRRPQ